MVSGGLITDPSAAAKFYKEMGSMSGDDIAATLVHVLSAPPHVQVSLPSVTLSWGHEAHHSSDGWLG